MYEGLLAGYKLLARNDKIVTYVLLNDMWGPTKISAKENKIFSQINTLESIKNSSQTSVWKLADTKIQFY